MLKEYLKNVRDSHPLIHNITNYVTVNDVANILLACGASPIMADELEEAEEITSICNGLNINIGTLNSRTIPAMLAAGKKAEELGHALLLDPVGAGASRLRTDTALKLMENIQFDIIRGNISEIKTLAKHGGHTKGVDADASDEVREDNLAAENGHEKPWKVSYFGVGNENWGCGGNMRPEFYGNEYRRYQTYIRNYKADAPIYKIACGPNVDDYLWTEGVLQTCTDPMGRKARDFMNGLSLHYYTVPGDWGHKGSATEFDEKEYYVTLKKTLYMEKLIKGHGAIMDRYDPEKKIGLIIDEWGIWLDVEPGTNPGFLYQQNSMRDAIIAGINLNLFNKHCDRVKMANIAQMVNVLQSVILTEGEKMVLTPTYYVFDMYKYHQDAELLESSIDTEEIGLEEKHMVPNLTESVSQAEDGTINITIANLSATDSYPIESIILEKEVKEVSAEILTGKINDYNDFNSEEKVKTTVFDGIATEGNTLKFTIPACSVLHIAIK